MNDDNGYIILQQLVDSDKSKENDVYMSPDEMYEFSESYGDNYVELIQGFTDKYYDSEASNENATKLLNIFYDEGIIKKKNSNENEYPTDSILPSGSGQSDYSGDEYTPQSVVEGDSSNFFPLNRNTKDSNFYGFEWNQSEFESKWAEIWGGVGDLFRGYDQDRYVIVEPESGLYFVNGEVADPNDLSPLDYEQAWVNAHNNDLEGMSGEYIYHPSQITYPHGGANYDIHAYELGANNMREGSQSNNLTGTGFHLPILQDKIATYHPSYGDNKNQIEFNYWDAGSFNPDFEYDGNVNYQFPTINVIEELGQHQYFYNHGGNSYEGSIPEKRLEVMLRKDNMTENYYIDDILKIHETVEDRLGNFFYASEDWNKDLFRMNHIIAELIKDRRRNPDDRKFHTSVRDEKMFEKENGRPLKHNTSYVVSKFNDDGLRIYNELLDIYTSVYDNILDAEYGVVQGREYYMSSSVLDGNSFYDAVAMGDNVATDIYFKGISSDTSTPIQNLYVSYQADQFNPVNTVLNNISQKRHEKNFNELSTFEQMSIANQLNPNSSTYNPNMTQAYEASILEEIERQQKLFITVPRGSAGEGWSDDAVENEIELFNKIKELNKELDKTDGDPDKINTLEREIQKLRDDMSWIGDEMFDTNGMRIDKVTLEQMEEADPKGAARVEQFNSDFKSKLSELEGYYDENGEWVVPDIVDILSLYHQSSSEYLYLEDMKENYTVTLESGTKIKLKEIINNPRLLSESYGNMMLGKLMEKGLVGTGEDILSGDFIEQIQSMTDNDRLRLGNILDKWTEHHEQSVIDMLASGRFVLLNSDPGTIDYENGWLKSLGEGLYEGVVNLFNPTHWNLFGLIGGEPFDYQGVKDVNRMSIEWAQQNGYPLTDAQLESMDRTWTEEAMYGLGASIPLLVAISAVTGPLAGTFTRTAIGGGSRLTTNLLSRMNVGGKYVQSVNNAKTFKDAYNATLISLRNSSEVGHFTLRLSEEMAKGYLSFEMTGAHGSMGAGLHAGTHIFNSLFPQTHLSRWLFWDKSSPINVRPDAKPLFKDGIFMGWTDDAGNIIKNLGKVPLNETPLWTKATEKLLQFNAGTMGGTMGMYVGEVFDHASKNGIDLEGIWRDVFGVGIEDDEYKWLDKFGMTLFLSAVFTSAQTVKMESAIENVLVRYSKDATVPQGVRDQLNTYLASYNKHKILYQTDFKKMLTSTKGTEQWKELLLKDPYSQYYNIDIDARGNITARELSPKDGFFSKESFVFNKKTNSYEVSLPNTDLKFTLKRLSNNKKTLREGENPGDFYIDITENIFVIRGTRENGEPFVTSLKEKELTPETIEKYTNAGWTVTPQKSPKRVYLGKTKNEAINLLNEYVSQKILDKQSAIVKTQNPLAGVFDYIAEYNRPTINKEQSMLHDKNGFSVYNDRGGNQQGTDAYLVKMFPETRLEITSEGLISPLKDVTLTTSGLKDASMDVVIKTYKEMFENVLLGSKVLDVVTYTEGGKTYIEIMGRTQSTQHANILAKKYNVGEILNLKDLSSQAVEITGMDINKNPNVESIINQKTMSLDFNKTGLKNLDPNNPNFQKSFTDRLADYENVAFLEQSRNEAIVKVTDIINNFQKTSKNKNMTSFNEGFYGSFRKELLSDQVPSIEQAYDNAVTSFKEALKKLEKSKNPRTQKQYKDGLEFISRIERMGKEKFIKLVTPNYYLEGVNSRLVKDNIIEAVDEFLSFERKPDEILFEQDYSNYERDANGNVVYKSKEQQSNNFKNQLEKDKKNYKDDFYEYFEKTKEGFKLKIEKYWENIGERGWDAKKKVKEALKLRNRILGEFYDKVAVDNPQLALWLRSKGAESIMYMENAAGASGWSKTLSKDVRNLFNDMHYSTLVKFQNISWARHIISMDLAKDRFKIELDKSIEELNFMVENNYSAKEIERVFNQLKEKAENNIVSDKGLPLITVKEIDGVYNLYGINGEIIKRSTLNDKGEINTLNHQEFFVDRVVDGQTITVFDCPWRVNHGNKEVNVYDLSTARSYLENYKNELTPAVYDKINAKVDIMFNHHKMLAKEMLDAGIINQSAYNEMIKRDYIPRDFVEMTAGGDWKVTETISYTDSGWQTTQIGAKENIFGDLQYLNNGSQGKLNMNLEQLTLNKTSAVAKMIFDNRVRNSLGEFIRASEVAAKQYGDMSFTDFGFSLNLLNGKNIEVRGKELGLTEKELNNYIEIEYRVDGVSKHFAIHRNMYDSLINRNAWSSMPGMSQWSSMISGAYFTRMTSTILSPVFSFKNFFRDSMHILQHTDNYSIYFPEAVRQFSGDLKSVATAAFSFNKAKNPLMQEYYKAGGSFDYLTNQARRTGADEGVFQSESWIQRYIDKKSPGHQILFEANRLSKNRWKNFLDFFSYMGESSEAFTRLAVYQRSLKNQTNSFISENGRQPTAKEIELMQSHAASSARRTIDFNQGGSWTKLIDSFIPYTNASIQGFRVSAKYWKENPGQAAFKFTQLATYVGGLNTSNWANHPEEMERLWKTKPWEPVNNFIFFIPGLVNEDGSQGYIKLAKDHMILGPTATIEGLIAEQFTGINYTAEGSWNPFVSDENKNLIMQATQSGLPFGGGEDIINIEKLVSQIPLYRTLSGSKHNFNYFRQEQIYYNNYVGDEALAQEILYPSEYGATNQFYIDLAETFGGSPERWKQGLGDYGIGKGYIFDIALFGYNKMFDQPTQTELGEEYNQYMNSGMQEFFNQLSEPFKDALVGYIDPTMEVTELTNEGVEKIETMKVQDEILQMMQDQYTTYFIKEIESIYKEIPDIPWTTGVNETNMAVNKKVSELTNIMLSQLTEGKDGYKVDLLDEEAIMKIVDNFAENVVEISMYNEKGINRDMRMVHKYFKYGDMKTAAMSYYALLDVVGPLKTAEIEKMAIELGMYDSDKFEKYMERLQEGGYEKEMEYIGRRQKFAEDVRKAIFNSEKFGEYYLNGTGGFFTIDLGHIEAIVDWNNIPEEDFDSDGNPNQDVLNKAVEEYLENALILMNQIPEFY